MIKNTLNLDGNYKDKKLIFFFSSVFLSNINWNDMFIETDYCKEAYLQMCMMNINQQILLDGLVLKKNFYSIQMISIIDLSIKHLRRMELLLLWTLSVQWEMKSNLSSMSKTCFMWQLKIFSRSKKNHRNDR